MTGSFTSFLSRALSVAGLVAMLAALLPLAAQAERPGAIWTTDSCSGGRQDVNQYQVGEPIYVRGSGFASGQSLTVTVAGQPGSGDPGQVVASVPTLADANGDFCVLVYQVQEGDFGVYTVDAGGKNDNYNVAASPSPTASPTAANNAPSPTSTPTTSPTALATSEASIPATPTSTTTVTVPTPTTTAASSVTPTATASVSAPTPTSTPEAILLAPTSTPRVSLPIPTATSPASMALPTATSSPSSNADWSEEPEVTLPATAPKASTTIGAAPQTPRPQFATSEVSAFLDKPSSGGAAVQALPATGYGPDRGRSASLELLALGLLLAAFGFAGMRAGR